MGFCGPGLASRQEASTNMYCMCQQPIGRGFFLEGRGGGEEVGVGGKERRVARNERKKTVYT